MGRRGDEAGAIEPAWVHSAYSREIIVRWWNGRCPPTAGQEVVQEEEVCRVQISTDEHHRLCPHPMIRI